MSTSVLGIVYDPHGRSRQDRGGDLKICADGLLDRCERLTLYVADEAAAFPSSSPFPLWGPRPIAVLDLASRQAQDCIDSVGRALTRAGYDVHWYDNAQTVPDDYGSRGHLPPRDWADGEASPAAVTVNFLRRPASLSVADWVARWHGVMSPVSGDLQPRSRYVRNHLTRPHDAHSPPWEGVAMDSWPSPRHIANPMLFYGASTRLQMLRNMLAIVRAVHHCFWIWQVHTVPMTEFFLRTPEDA